MPEQFDCPGIYYVAVESQLKRDRRYRFCDQSDRDRCHADQPHPAGIAGEKNRGVGLPLRITKSFSEIESAEQRTHKLQQDQMRPLRKRADKAEKDKSRRLDRCQDRVNRATGSEPEKHNLRFDDVLQKVHASEAKSGAVGGSRLQPERLHRRVERPEQLDIGISA